MAVIEARGLSKTYGTFTFDAMSGAWTYTLANNSSAVQALAVGQIAHDQLTVTCSDGSARFVVRRRCVTATSSSARIHATT